MDVVRAGVLHLAVDVVPLRHSALLPDQRRTNPTQRTISELRRLALYTKGDFPDIAHKTDCVSFVEYAYAVKTMQPNVPKKFRDAMKLADADLWRVAAKKRNQELARPKMSTAWFHGLQFLQERKSSVLSGYSR